jgi:hypothetical protein
MTLWGVLGGCGGRPLQPNGHAGKGGAGTGGGDGGDASAGPHSPGAVTLRMVVPGSDSFCDQTCGGPVPHILILDADGNALPTTMPWCGTAFCESCRPTGCLPGGTCALEGVKVTGDELKWDGRVYPESTCGAGVTCYQSAFVPPGRYVAHMCATRGDLFSAGDTLPPVCTMLQGHPVCVDVPFNLPGDDVVGTLPSACVAIRAADYDQRCGLASDCVNVAEGNFCEANAGCTNCPTTAINVSAQPQYELAVQANTPHPSICPCPATPPPACVNGKCVRGTFGPP